MDILKLALACACVAGGASPGLAQSGTLLNYTLTDNGIVNIFSLYSNPNVDTAFLGEFFTTNDTSGTVFGFAESGYAAQFGYNTLGDEVDYSGPQLYSGSESDPTLLAGDYKLTDEATGNAATLSVAVAPEPATWAMMILGLGLAGGVLYRQHRKSEEGFTSRVRLLATA